MKPSLLDQGDKASPGVKLLAEWLSQIKPVSDELQADLLGAEICLTLTITPISEGLDRPNLRTLACATLRTQVE